MNIVLKKSSIYKQQSTIQITGSKSETNRLLLLKALYPNILLENASVSDDSDVMFAALHSNSDKIDIHHAGTAMRFLTSYFAIQQEREVFITGSSRMKERPIKILVEALRQLGADIIYTEQLGFPPLKIFGKKITKNKVTVAANVSSQYISALLLIAPKLENGLELYLEGSITSIPYIKMTLGILNDLGIDASFQNNLITVKPYNIVSNPNFIIESDWSSASYYYSIIALSPLNTEISLSNFKENSLQGDAVLKDIYKNFGVETTFVTNGIRLKKTGSSCHNIDFDLNSSPDIAQTIVVTCLGLGVESNLKGLHTLRIKETNRLEALKLELTKLGASVIITESTLKLESTRKLKTNVSINTYQDHRMAMAFAPLALKVPLKINDSEVVSKSYPTFWEDLKSIGFQISNETTL
ncbi:MAG: 3-phosphoshikimate 1-carboxyvinyltransferase [Flavobacterium sp.]